MFNANIPVNFRPIRNIPPMEEGLTSSNLTVQEGAPLVRNADGTIGLATHTSATILGYAAHGVTGTAGTRARILFYPAVRNMVLEGRTAPGTSITQTLAFGRPVGLSLAANGYVIKLNASTTFTVLQTVGYSPNTRPNASLAVLRVITSKSLWPVAG